MRIQKKLLPLTVFILVLILFGKAVYAANDQIVGIGGVAQNLLSGPISFFGEFINTGCFVIGGSFLFASIIKYFEHRKTPVLVPISTVIFLLIAGIILIILPFLAAITEGGVQYSSLFS